MEEEKYNDEMYKYLTERKNFKAAMEIEMLLPDIKDRLKKEFWDEVKDKLNKIYHELNLEISIKPDNEIKIEIKRKNWNGLSISTGFDKNSVDIGIVFDENIFERNKLKEKVRKFNLTLGHLEENCDNWLCWESINNDFDFNNSESLFKILPEKRVDLINELVNFVKNNTDKMYKICDESIK